MFRRVADDRKHDLGVILLSLNEEESSCAPRSPRIFPSPVAVSLFTVNVFLSKPRDPMTSQ